MKLLKPFTYPQSPPQTIDCTLTASITTGLTSVKSVSGAGNLVSIGTISDGSVTILRIVIIADGVTVADMANVNPGADSKMTIPMNVRFETSLDIQAIRTSGTGAYLIPNIYKD